MRKILTLFLFIKIAIHAHAQFTIYDQSNSSIELPTIKSIAFDGATMWISNQYLMKYDGTNFTKNIPPSTSTLYDIAVDGNGDIWAAGGLGLAKFDGVSWTEYTMSNSNIPFNICKKIATDNSGNIWFSDGECATCDGVAKFDGVNFTQFKTSNSSLPNNDVRAILSYNSSIWFGTYGGGLAKFDGTNWTIYNSSNSGIGNNWIYDLALDTGNNLWIATNYGLVKFDGDTTWTIWKSNASTGLPHNVVYGIGVESNGTVWVGSAGSGIAKFDGTIWTKYNSSNSNFPTESSGTGNKSVTCISAGNGKVWIGTSDKGLLSISGTTGLIEESAASALNLFPNPIINNAVIEINRVVHDAELQIVDVLGKKVSGYHYSVSGNQINFSRENLPAGFYFYKIFAENEILGSGKMVIN